MKKFNPNAFQAIDVRPMRRRRIVKAILTVTAFFGILTAWAAFLWYMLDV